MLALSSPALLMGLACAVAFSGSDYFRKIASSTCGPALTLFYLVGLQMPVLLAWFAWSGDTHLDHSYWLPGAIDAATGLLSNLLFLWALQRSPLSLMVPLLGAVPALTAVVAGAALGEWPSTQQDLGIVLVAAGLILVFVPAGGGYHPSVIWRNFRYEPGVPAMTAVVVLWSATPALDKICVDRSSVGIHGVLQLLLLFVPLGIWLMVRRGARAMVPPPGALVPLTAAALTSGIGYALQLAAYRLTLVAIIELLKRLIGMIGALIFGRMILKEPLTSTRVAGIAIIAGGLPFVLLA